MLKGRSKFLLGVLGLVAATWVASYFQDGVLAGELEEIAKEKMEYLQRGEPVTLEMSPVVTASRQYLLFGKTTGKISIYTRTPGHGEDDHLGGVDFFMERAGGEWVEVESAHCSAEECQTLGRSAFAKRVLTVRP